MAELKFHKINSGLLPMDLEPNAFYYLQKEVTYDGQTRTIAEAYLTNQAGVARAIGNAGMIRDISFEIVSNFMASMQTLLLVADLAERDVQAAEGAQVNKLILVADASADPTVNLGAALYFYSADAPTGSQFTKVAEYESMDVELDWASLKNKPLSSVEAIDDAVDKRHAHSNKAVLDKLSENTEGKPLYAGATLGGAMEWAETSW